MLRVLRLALGVSVVGASFVGAARAPMSIDVIRRKMKERKDRGIFGYVIYIFNLLSLWYFVS